MKDSLAVPLSVEEIYEARGDEVAPYRTFFPGDVLDSVQVPGFEKKCLAVIMQHPCSMRTGATLRKRLTLARVEKQTKLQLPEWSKHF